jgi:hypothetical protein
MRVGKQQDKNKPNTFPLFLFFFLSFLDSKLSCFPFFFFAVSKILSTSFQVKEERIMRKKII